MGLKYKLWNKQKLISTSSGKTNNNANQKIKILI